MVTQQMVDSHSERIRSAARTFAELLSVESGKIATGTTSKLTTTLTVEDGEVVKSDENSRKLLELAVVFEEQLVASNYWQVVYAFLSSLSQQVKEFAAFYGAMRESRRLPDFAVSDDLREKLADQAGLALVAVTSKLAVVRVELGQLLAGSLGTTDVATLSKGISEVVRKLAKVEPVARDQVILFFRIVGNSVYKELEASGQQFRYELAGPQDESNREFCSSALGKSFTRAEIESMNNGQLRQTFLSAGGHGCRHWWKIEDHAPVELVISRRSTLSQQIAKWSRRKVAGFSWASK